MIKFGQKFKESVGLDIGTYSIKVISIKKEKESNILTGYNIKNVPPDAKSTDTERLVQEAFDEIDLHPDEVNLAISGPSVIVRFVDMPRMNKDQLESALGYEAEKYIPFNINEVVIDFLILGDAEEAGQMRVLIAAAKRDLVESRVNLLDKMGIDVGVMDIVSFAIFNAFLASGPVEEKGNAFFDFGHSESNVLISIGSQPCFMRQIQIGGKDIAKAISKDMGVPLEKAEELKVNADEVSRERVRQSSFTILEEIMREMQLSFGYFENRYNTSVSNLYCSGGMLFQEGVMEYFETKSGLKVERWNPAKGLSVAENLSLEVIDSVSPQLAVSIGLALRD
ncbi:MAG: type IV pilus assembly protein PilM [Candidatus Omnitrophota bacterium]